MIARMTRPTPIPLRPDYSARHRESVNARRRESVTTLVRSVIAVPVPKFASSGPTISCIAELSMILSSSAGAFCGENHRRRRPHERS
jgi:hypothetical protein